MWSSSRVPACWALLILMWAACPAAGLGEASVKKKHHHHHHHHGKHHRIPGKDALPGSVAKPNVAQVATNGTVVTSAGAAANSTSSGAAIAKSPLAPLKALPQAASEKVTVNQEAQIVSRMRTLEKELASKEKAHEADHSGHVEVNGPLPFDFSSRFENAVAQAFGVKATEVKLTAAKSAKDSNAPGAMEVIFSAPPRVVQGVEDEAADPDSKLAHGSLRMFLVASDSSAPEDEAAEAPPSPTSRAAVPGGSDDTTGGIDVDTEMPYGELEPFGREDTAQELTEQSIKESDEMVDQLERAEVAEEKRAVFRALTRLRGAAITSFDGVARSQTGNIDEYNKLNKWRSTHPLHHLADEESDISKWAFPDNADF